MAHFILPAVILVSAGLASAAATVASIDFTLDKVAEAASAAPVRTNLKPSYIAVLPPAKAAALDISRAIPVVVSKAEGPADQLMKVQPAFTHSVAVESLRVRSGPKKSTPQLFALKGGTKVNVLREERGWLFIDTGTGQKGWVYGKLLRPVATTEAALH